MRGAGRAGEPAGGTGRAPVRQEAAAAGAAAGLDSADPEEDVEDAEDDDEFEELDVVELTVLEPDDLLSVR
ncbi:hypothetical protein PS9374_05961 [Planomonospora sphaerica]|uniref:Uncharacterized protein n=1 Tax=Planomonospora sphaerica TaxID=161355 RepID=A0A171DMP7_9ACTN|nr:hypothetical protein PS9374_05961 [Planomonospora sphaerica]